MHRREAGDGRQEQQGSCHAAPKNGREKRDLPDELAAVDDGACLAQDR